MTGSLLGIRKKLKNKEIRAGLIICMNFILQRLLRIMGINMIVIQI